MQDVRPSELSRCHRAHVVSAYLGEAAALSRLLTQQRVPSVGNHGQRERRETAVARGK